MDEDGLAYKSMFANGSNNFGLSASDYVPTPTSLRLSENINKYSDMFGKYTDVNGVVSGNMPSKAAFDAVDVTKAPAVFNDKGLFDWSLGEANKINIAGGGSAGLNSPKDIGDVDKGIWDKTTDFLGSDAMKGVGTVAGIGLGLANIFNSMSAQKQAKKQWEAENARANELMAMNREKYNTYKADKARLNSQYV